MIEKYLKKFIKAILTKSSSKILIKSITYMQRCIGSQIELILRIFSSLFS